MPPPFFKKSQSSNATTRMQALGRLKPGQMNKTEAKYAALLELRKHAGEITWYKFEAINLRLADRTFYAVDFLVMLASGELEAHEVKGGYITDDALVKIKVAASIFPFRFCIAQKKGAEWVFRDF